MAPLLSKTAFAFLLHTPAQARDVFLDSQSLVTKRTDPSIVNVPQCGPTSQGGGSTLRNVDDRGTPRGGRGGEGSPHEESPSLLHSSTDLNPTNNPTNSTSCYCSLAGLFPCKAEKCIITCDQYQASFAPDQSHHCPCADYQQAKCFASKCVECPDECLPPPLDKIRTTLGTKLLCCAEGRSKKRCDPCCTAEHGSVEWRKRVGVPRGTCCELDCPCAVPGSDCPRGLFAAAAGRGSISSEGASKNGEGEVGEMLFS